MYSFIPLNYWITCVLNLTVSLLNYKFQTKGTILVYPQSAGLLIQDTLIKCGRYSISNVQSACYLAIQWYRTTRVEFSMKSHIEDQSFDFIQCLHSWCLLMEQLFISLIQRKIAHHLLYCLFLQQSS